MRHRASAARAEECGALLPEPAMAAAASRAVSTWRSPYVAETLWSVCETLLDCGQLDASCSSCASVEPVGQEHRRRPGTPLRPKESRRRRPGLESSDQALKPLMRDGVPLRPWHLDPPWQAHFHSVGLERLTLRYHVSFLTNLALRGTSQRLRGKSARQEAS